MIRASKILRNDGKNKVKTNFDYIDSDEMKYITNAFIKEKGLVSHHIDSYNFFIDKGINDIVTSGFTAEDTFDNKRTENEEDRSIETISYKITFTKVVINPPRAVESYIGRNRYDLYPNSAMTNDRTYSGNMFVDAEIVAKAYLKGKDGEYNEKSAKEENVRVADIPILVKSNKCHLKDANPEQLWSLREDPTDPGGYVIINGYPWCLDSVENRVFNWPHAYHNIGHKDEKARLEFISKPGDSFDNSAQIILRYHKDDRITIEIDHEEFRKKHIPFYIIFRLLGMTTDKEIIDNIAYGYDPNEFYGKEINKYQDILDMNERNPRYLNTINIVEKLKNAFEKKSGDFSEVSKLREPAEIANALIKKIFIMGDNKDASGKSIKSESTERYYINNIMSILDNWILPHVGKSAKCRHEKLRFLGHLFNRLLLVEMDIIASSDRDTLNYKRIYPAGYTLSKGFKGAFNLSIIQKIKKTCKKMFETNTFSRIELSDIIKNGIDKTDFEKTIHTSIVSGNESISTKDNKVLRNHIPSQRLEYKNPLNIYSMLRTIRAASSMSSKADTRSYEMRFVHPSYFGYICPIQSADTGSNVGMAKQMALTAFVSLPGQSLILKEQLLEDKELVIPWNLVYPNDIYKYNFNKIFVNGSLIGCTVFSYKLVKKYRDLRRKSANAYNGIDKYTTIYWDPFTSDVYFWVDLGRLLRPIVIVYNTEDDLHLFDKQIQNEVNKWEKTRKGPYPYYQKTLLTRKIINDLKNDRINNPLTYLQEKGIVEYLSPDELENCMLATSIDEVYQNETNYIKKYTHCEIPINVLGMAALTAPFGHNNQVVRQVYETNQAKQTCSIPALNWPFHFDKHIFVQYNSENPLVGTYLNNITYPNGFNSVVAVNCGGWNQEDSLIINEDAVDRGLGNGSHYDAKSFTKKKTEIIMTPDIKLTKDYKKNCNYEKLEKGIIKKGSVLTKGTVILGKVIEIKDPELKEKYKDISEVYYSEEISIVEDIIQDYNQDDEKLIKIKYRSIRNLCIGDKLSSRFGQKGINGMMYKGADMPFTENGIIPDIIMNPHAFPSRMTIGQYKEGQTAKACAIGGYRTDATIFKQLVEEEIGEELEAQGYHRYGKERMFNGQTGEWIDVLLFITPIYYQRLQKFIIDQVYYVRQGATDQTTRQPLSGKGNRGGLRIGEMEVGCYIANGNPQMLMEKIRDHSDGTDIYICNNCQRRAIVDHRQGNTKCKYCKDNSDIVRNKNGWINNLFIDEIESMGIGIKLGTKPYEYIKYE